MTGKPLAKMYAQLAIPERYPLMIAALNRDDDVEFRRLVDAASVVTVPMRDFEPFARAWFLMAAVQQIEQLRLAGWLNRFWLATHEAQAECNAEGTELAYDTSLIVAWQYRQARTAWKLFCQEMGFNDRDPLPGMPNDLLSSDPFLDKIDARVADLKLDVNIIAALLKKKLGQEAPTLEKMKSVESRLQTLRDDWAIWQGKWPTQPQRPGKDAL